MSTVLITGGTGFIGKALIDRLIEEKVKVYALVLPKEAEKLPKSNYVIPVEGDLLDIEKPIEQLKNVQIDMIYHLAWVGVSTTFKNDSNIQLLNIKMAINIMNIANNHKIAHIVSTGSVSEYAYIQDAVNGNQLPCPCDLYSATKVSVHVFCEYYARLYGINFNWVLIPSIYGPGRVDNNLITYCIQSLLRGERPIFTKLEQIWDYIYIDDLVNALYLIGTIGKWGEVYPVGSGQARKMSEYVEIIKNLINPNAELGIGELPYKTKRIDNAIVDISKVKEDTGYQAKFSFEEGILQTIKYFEKEEKKNV